MVSLVLLSPAATARPAWAEVAAVVSADGWSEFTSVAGSTLASRIDAPRLDIGGAPPPSPGAGAGNGPVDATAAAADTLPGAHASPPPEGANASPPSPGASAAPDSTAAPPVRSSNVLIHAGQDFVHSAKVTGIDALHVLAAPLRLNRSSAVWAVGIIGTGIAIYSLDMEIYDATQRARGNPAYDALLDVGDAIEPVGLMGRTWPYWTGLWAVGKVTRVEVLQQIPLEVLESHLIAGGVRNLGKLILGRRRPFEKEGSHQFQFNGGTSFPSGHTSVAFEIATVLSHHAGNWPVSIASYALAGAMAVQRVDSGNHWASDCFIPAVTGTLTARTVIHRNAERRAREEGRPTAHLFPYAAPNGAGLLVEVRF